MKILIADDDAVSRSMMRRLLTQSGFEVSTASNGVEAISSLHQDDGPRLLLLDWMMPGLDGPEVCKAIRTGARRAYIYITLLTSKDSKEDLVAGLEAGADDYLTKPCNLEELRARLRTGERILQLEDNLVNAREEMRFRATHDGLTTLLNRNSILARLRDNVERANETGKEFAVVICDVDHFKRINDTCGHPVGDEVLREVSARLKRTVRSNDAVGRFGGEEFLFVLEGCTEEALARISEMICFAIRASAIATSEGELAVSISAGSIHVDGRMPDVTADEILRRVDVALYQAKSEGRNRFIVASMTSELVAETV